MSMSSMKQNPVEENEEKATQAHIAVRSLGMKGAPQKNLDFLERLSKVGGYGAS